MADVEHWTAAGLYDPKASGAADRLALLNYLGGEGCTVEELVAADARGRLNSAAGDRQLAVERCFTRVEAAERSGLSPEQVDRAWLAVGFRPITDDERAFSVDDLEFLGAVAMGSELFGFDAILQFSRVVGSSLARIADAATASFLVNVQRPLDRDHVEPIDLAKADTISNQLLFSMPEITAPVFRRLARDSIYRGRGRRPDEYDVFRNAVGFLDLVGYTAWCEQLGPNELARAVNDFEQAAGELITMNGGRVVKNIGDAVMYVTSSTDIACRVALELCRFVDEHPLLTRLRAAVAVGDVQQRDGDYFGSTVNRAARLVKEAEPGTLVSDAEVDGFSAERRGTTTLRGIDEPVPVYRITLPKTR